METFSNYLKLRSAAMRRSELLNESSERPLRRYQFLLIKISKYKYCHNVNPNARRNFARASSGLINTRCHALAFALDWHLSQYYM